MAASFINLLPVVRGVACFSVSVVDLRLKGSSTADAPGGNERNKYRPDSRRYYRVMLPAEFHLFSH